MENEVKTLPPEVVQEIRRLHFQARRLVDESITGGYRSAFRGRGMEFEEVREYVPGDDVRAIDWKVTARSQKPYLKVFREERELTVVIALDVSASTRTGTGGELREHLIAKVGAVLAAIALQNNDRVGLVTFSDRVHSFEPPRKGRGIGWRLIHEALSAKSESLGTSFAAVCEHLSRVLKRRSVIFFLSDLFDPHFASPLRSLARKHDVTVIQVSDKSELTLPEVGLLQVRDPESGSRVLLDCSHRAVRVAYEQAGEERQRAVSDLLRAIKVGHIELVTGNPFLRELRRFFERRVSAR